MTSKFLNYNVKDVFIECFKHKCCFINTNVGNTIIILGQIHKCFKSLICLLRDIMIQWVGKEYILLPCYIEIIYAQEIANAFEKMMSL